MDNNEFDVDQYQDELNDAVNDGGGCIEIAEQAAEQRELIKSGEDSLRHLRSYLQQSCPEPLLGRMRKKKPRHHELRRFIWRPS